MEWWSRITSMEVEESRFISTEVGGRFSIYFHIYFHWLLLTSIYICFHWLTRASISISTFPPTFIDFHRLPPTSTDFHELSHRLLSISIFYRFRTAFLPLFPWLLWASSSSSTDFPSASTYSCVLFGRCKYMDVIYCSLEAGATSTEAGLLPNKLEVDLPPWKLVEASMEVDRVFLHGSKWKLHWK